VCVCVCVLVPVSVCAKCGSDNITSLLICCLGLFFVVHRLLPFNYSVARVPSNEDLSCVSILRIAVLDTQIKPVRFVVVVFVNTRIIGIVQLVNSLSHILHSYIILSLRLPDPILSNHSASNSIHSQI
jgi:hypothetical protein